MRRHSTILFVGLVTGALCGAGLPIPARAQAQDPAPGTGVVETSPAGSAVRTYSNGVRVPVPGSMPGTAAPGAAGSAAPDTTGAIAPAGRVPDPRTTRNPLGCPEIDPLCQGR